MKKFFQYKILPLFFCLLFCLGVLPISAKGQAPEMVSHLSLAASLQVDPQAFNNASAFVKGLASLFSRLDFSAEGLVAPPYQAKLDFSVKDRQEEFFSGHIYGDTFGYKITSNLFNNASVSLNLPQYLPFLQKFYDYFFSFSDEKLPIHYIGLATDVYSFEYAFKPFLSALSALFEGTRERYYSPQEVVNQVTAFHETITQSDAFISYLKSFLHPMGLDYLADDFFVYDLPAWAQSLAGEGLSINVYPDYEIWSAGSHVILQKEVIDGHQIISLTLPPYENISLSLEYLLIPTATGYTLSGSIALDYKDEEDEEDRLLFLSLEGDYHHDEQKGDTITNAAITLKGSSVETPWTLAFSAPSTVTLKGDATHTTGAISLLNVATKKPMVTLSYNYTMTPYEGAFFPAQDKHITGPDIPLFSINDRDESFKNLKQFILFPAAKKLIPFVLSMPASVVLPLAQWALQQGLFAMALSPE